ncbi:hypothetical protein GCM10011247_09940 [Pseudomonas plecoglossicida]|nr:hypothetical protein GCM10011247_09940 [Pseudomonas plecoglossicida]
MNARAKAATSRVGSASCIRSSGRIQSIAWERSAGTCTRFTGSASPMLIAVIAATPSKAPGRVQPAIKVLAVDGTLSSGLSE